MHTAVILAGGKSRRMQRDKMTLTLGGQTFLEAAAERFSRCFDTLYLSVAEADKYHEIKAERLVDIYPGCGPISGLHAALSRTTDEGVFLVAADMPFSDPLAAQRIIELTGERDIGALTDGNGRFEPLFAYYKKSILPIVERAIASGDYKLKTIFDKVSVKTVIREELGGLYSDRLLLNVNYPEDYEKLVRERSPD